MRVRPDSYASRALGLVWEDRNQLREERLSQKLMREITIAGTGEQQ